MTLSSSGTTTRTVEALLVARALGARTLALSNTAGSALMVESEHGLMVRAERKGWPTQASTAALALLLQFGLDLARALGRKPTLVDSWQQALEDVPRQIEVVLAGQEEVVRESPNARRTGRSISMRAVVRAMPRRSSARPR